MAANAPVPNRTLKAFAPDQANRFIEAAKGDRLDALLGAMG